MWFNLVVDGGKPARGRRCRPQRSSGEEKSSTSIAPFRGLTNVTRCYLLLYLVIMTMSILSQIFRGSGRVENLVDIFPGFKLCAYGSLVWVFLRTLWSFYPRVVAKSYTFIFPFFMFFNNFWYFKSQQKIWGLIWYHDEWWGNHGRLCKISTGHQEKLQHATAVSNC